MAIPSGLDAQVGFGEEQTYGTYEAPDRFLEFVSEGLALTIERIESSALRVGSRVQRSTRWEPNRKGAAGDVSFEVANKGFGLLFKHMLGAAATSQPDDSGSPNTYLHTFTLGNLDDSSLTVQVGKPDVGGTVRPFSYLGCKVASWELSCDVDGLLMLNLSFDGQDEDLSESLESASFPSDDEVYSFTSAVLELGGEEVHVNSFSISGDNGLATDRYFLRGNSLKKEQLQAGILELTGSLEAEFEDLDLYNKFVNGTVGALTATFTGSLIEDTFSNQLTVTLPAVRVEGETPTVGGPEILTQSLEFKVLDNTSDEPITLTYQTEDETP